VYTFSGRHARVLGFFLPRLIRACTPWLLAGRRHQRRRRSTHRPLAVTRCMHGHSCQSRGIMPLVIDAFVVVPRSCFGVRRVVVGPNDADSSNDGTYGLIHGLHLGTKPPRRDLRSQCSWVIIIGGRPRPPVVTNDASRMVSPVGCQNQTMHSRAHLVLFLPLD